MARVFTIIFNYKEQAHSALVYQTVNKNELFYQVRLLDQQLEPLVHGGTFSFSSTDGLQKHEFYRNEQTKELFSTITAEINAFLRAKAPDALI